MNKLGMIIELIGALTVVATLIANLTPSTSDNEKVNKVAAWVNRIIKFLPTIGINPNTRVLEEKVKKQ